MSTSNSDPPKGLDGQPLQIRMPEALRARVSDAIKLLEVVARNHAAKRQYDAGLSDKQKVLFEVVEWVFSTDEVMKILGFITEDIRLLEDRSPSREVWLRYRVLVRSYFHECFRAKENFFRFTRKLRKLGLLEPVGEEAWRADYAECFRHTINARHTASHSDLALLPSEEDLLLSITFADFNYKPRASAPGERWSPQSALSRAITEATVALGAETHRIGLFHSDLLERCWPALDNFIVNYPDDEPAA